MSELAEVKGVVSKLETSTEMTVDQCCEASGVTLKKVYDTLADLLDAKIFAKDKFGDSIEIGPDNRVRLAAVSLALELKKHIKDKEGAGNANQLNIIIKSRGTTEEAKEAIKEAEIV